MQMIAPRVSRDILSDVLVSNEAMLTDLLGEMVAHTGFGLVVVTEGRQIVYANDAAETLMRAGNGLCSKHGRVSTMDFDSSRQLQSLISAVARQANVPAQGGTLILRDEDGQASVVVHVVPLSRRLDVFSPDDTCPAAGLLIADYQPGHSDRIKVFSELFGLTTAETRVLAHLISGGGVTKVAERLKIAQSTAQTHLKRILEKTGTHRQAELVRAFYETTIPWYGRSRAIDERSGPWTAWLSHSADDARRATAILPSNDRAGRTCLSGFVAVPGQGRFVSPGRVPV